MKCVNKDIKKCKKCNTNLQKYYQQYKIKMQGFTNIYKRCSNCLEVYKITLK